MKRRTLLNGFLLSTALLLGNSSLAATPAADNSSLITTKLEINGAVELPMIIGLEELRRFPTAQLGEVKVICQSGADKGTLQNLRGVRLKDLLERAKIRAPGHFDARRMIVLATASDNYVAVFSLQELINSPVGEQVIVFFEKDGKPLGDDEGRIALVSAMDIRTGPRHVKWLKSIEVRKVVD